LSSGGLFAAPEKRACVLSLLLVVLTLGLYNQANHFSFISYDDDRYVYENPHVQAGLAWSTVKWALTSTDEANWHPLTWMSHALDCQLFRLNPAGHHLSSILLHAVNAVLLFLLLWRATRRMGLSFFVAALFALHPLNVESVAWVAERKNVLSTMFFFLTLGAYGWYALNPGWRRYLAVAGLLVCGLASKPMLVTLPFVLLLLDYWPLQRIQGWVEPSETLTAKQFTAARLVLEKLPLLALAGGSAIITLHAQRAAGAVSALRFALGVRLKNAIFCYAMYVGKAVWPTRLAALYPHPGNSLAIWKVSLAAVFLIATSTLVVKFRTRRYLVSGWLWFLGTLVPVIGLIQVGNQAMADRYAYVPLIGIFLMVTWGLGDLARNRKLTVAWAVVPAICALAALSVITYRQIGYWRNGMNLWTHALQVTERNFVAEDSLGAALVQQQRFDEAFPHFLKAAQYEPNDPAARLNIGAYLHQHGHIADAIRLYKLALALTPDARLRSTTYDNLGTAYRQLGEDAKAEAALEQSVQLNPNQSNAWLGLGLLAEQQGQLNEAISDFSRSVALQPTAESCFYLGRVLAQSGRRSEALDAYRNALRISPDLVEAQQAMDAIRQSK
jgi:tetratricopeptide (TPR) repeat protein